MGLKDRLASWGTTIPGVIVLTVAAVAFFLGKIDWATFLGAATGGAAFIGSK